MIHCGSPKIPNFTQNFPIAAQKYFLILPKIMKRAGSIVACPHQVRLSVAGTVQKGDKFWNSETLHCVTKN